MEDPIALRRKKLSEVRTLLANQSPTDPFSMSKTMISGETVSEFVVSIAINIHKKRTIKTKQDV